MKISFQVVASLVLPCLAISCSTPKSKGDDETFIKYVEQNRLGVSTDVWLERKSSLSGNWDKIGLFFGMVGDHAVCEQIVASLKATSEEKLEIRCIDAKQSSNTGEEKNFERTLTGHEANSSL